MLVPDDIVSAKLLVQAGFATEHLVREELRAAAQDPDAGLDLVARLVLRGSLAPEQVGRVRRWVALFEHVRQEAVLLRVLERRHGVARHEVHELIARLEAGAYRQRLLQALVELGRLSEDEARDLARAARRTIAAEDTKVLARYVEEDFAGVARPLIPGALEPGSFRVSTLFRSRDTQRRVARLVESLPPPASAATPEEFLPRGSSEEVEAVPDAPLPSSRQETARIREAPAPAEEAADLASREAIGPYEVVEVIGRGGMGAVYLGREEGTGTMVAVKVIQADRADPDDLARFRREARLTALARHEVLVHLIDEGVTEDGLDYMVIPFYAGRSLKALLKEQGALPLEQTLTVLEQLLAGLEAAHQAGIVHRDLKPENVFVLAGGELRVRLVDFGIARLIEPAGADESSAFRSRAGVISGSPAYIAPETITDEPLDGRADIYSLGVMTFELLTGRMPLFAESAYDYLREHLVGVPLTLAQGKRDVAWSPELEALVARMLAKEPADRPQRCAEVLAQLQGGLRERALDYARNPPPAAPGKRERSLFNGFFKILGG